MCNCKSIMYSVLLFTVLSLSEVATCLPSSFLQHKANLFGVAVQLLRTCGLPEVNNIKKITANCHDQRAKPSTQCVANSSCTRIDNDNSFIDSKNYNCSDNKIKSNGVNDIDDISTNCKDSLLGVNIP